ncbi:MAG TPA: YceI family protein [Candidatus Binatia bacterium]|jgi:polyisoprenoid-binding protein YceI|nr:YceI family protein [Candidatus Binatia bacterium]
MHDHAHEKKLIAAVLVVAALAGAYVYARRDARPAAPAPVLNEAPQQAPEPQVEGASVPATPAEELVAAEGETLYRIGAGSKASFTINEVLRGSPFTVVGETADVTGDIALDAANGKARIGLIAVDARTLKTDSRMRDGMIARAILRSGEPDNAFITFKPTSIDGLPPAIAPGAPFDLGITGDLTVAGATKQVTFKAAAQLTDDKIVAKADTDVLYKDFGLAIPKVPFVAGTDDDLTISIDIVAVKQ